MTLNASGPISLGGSTTGESINLELGLSATAQISLNDTAVRTLAGVASGAIVVPTNFYGKSSVAFDPDGGTTAGTAVYLSSDVAFESAQVTITCTQSAVWNWTRTGSGTPAATASIANGGSGTTMVFTLDRFDSGISVYTYTLNATSGGITRYWTVYLRVENV
jgi:hypothetical protein